MRARTVVRPDCRRTRPLSSKSATAARVSRLLRLLELTATIKSPSVRFRCAVLSDFFMAG